MGKNTSIELIYEIASEVRKRINVMSREIDDELVMEEIQKTIMEDSRTEYLSLQEKKGIMEGAFNSLRRELDFLEKYLDDPDISEIMSSALRAGNIVFSDISDHVIILHFLNIDSAVSNLFNKLIGTVSGLAVLAVN